jgi:hypothetical protein
MKIRAIRLDRMRLPLDPPFHAALLFPPAHPGIPGPAPSLRRHPGHGGHRRGRHRARPPPTSPSLFMAEHVRVIESIGFHAGRYWPLEAALWDITGQVTGQPASVLFGGATRRLPACASFGEARSPQARAQAALAAKSAGFRAAKYELTERPLVPASRRCVPPLVHPAHLDQRAQPAGQPARGGRRRRRPLRRVPVRPAGLDRNPPRLLPHRAHPRRRRRLPDRPRRPRPGRPDRPRRRRPLRPDRLAPNPSA